METVFFYLLLVLPASMAAVATAVRWSSLAQPGLFALVGFLSLLGLQACIRWLVLSPLSNFLPAAEGIKEEPAGELPLSFVLMHYGLQVALLVVLGTAVLVWLGNALSKA